MERDAQGEVAALANNSNCVVGIAFNAKIGGKSFTFPTLVQLLIIILRVLFRCEDA